MPFVLKDNATIYFKDERQIDIKTAYVRNDSLFSNNVGTEQFIGKRDSLDKIVVSSHKKGSGLLLDNIETLPVIFQTQDNFGVR